MYIGTCSFRGIPRGTRVLPFQYFWHCLPWHWDISRFQIIIITTSTARASTRSSGWPEAMAWPSVAWGRPGLRPRVRNPRPRKRPEAVMAWGHARPGHRPGHMFMKWPSQYIWKKLVLIAYYGTYSNSVAPDFFKLAAKNTICSLASNKFSTIGTKFSTRAFVLYSDPSFRKH